jgi:hypothetical protein
MKRLKRFKIFEATEEAIQDIYLDFKDKVQYLQDEFDHIEFETEISRSRVVGNTNYMICLWIKSVKKDSNGHLETFKVNDILPLLKNLNQFMEMNGLSIYHLISDTPNKPSKSVSKLEFPHEDVTRIYIVWD